MDVREEGGKEERKRKREERRKKGRKKISLEQSVLAICLLSPVSAAPQAPQAPHFHSLALTLKSFTAGP